MLSLVVPPGIGIVVNPRVTGELVGAAEAFGTAWELAGMRLLAGVGANVPGLVFQTVEGTVAERTLVRTREVLSHLLVCRTATLDKGRQQAHGRGHGHVRTGFRLGRVPCSSGGRRGRESGITRVLGVQKIVKIN